MDDGSTGVAADGTASAGAGHVAGAHVFPCRIGRFLGGFGRIWGFAPRAGDEIHHLRAENAQLRAHVRELQARGITRARSSHFHVGEGHAGHWGAGGAVQARRLRHLGVASGLSLTLRLREENEELKSEGAVVAESWVGKGSAGKSISAPWRVPLQGGRGLLRCSRQVRACC